MPILPSGVSQTWGQQTPATQARVGMYKRAGRKGGKRSAARRRKSASAGTKRKRKTASKGRKILRKGSAAAKKWGRKMARLRKRR